MNNSYNVTQKQWGILISGQISTDDFACLAKHYAKIYNYKLIDFEIAKKYGNCICLTSEWGAREWKKELHLTANN